MDSTVDANGRRMAILEELKLVSTAAEAAFDRFVFAAAQIFRVPIAFITLIDGDRLRFKSRLGLCATETVRLGAFCTATMAGNGALMVEDAQMDERFRHSPFVTGAPGLRFYAGVPLVSPDGVPLGTLCVADTRARSATDQQLWALAQLARAVLDTLLMRLSAHGCVNPA